MQRVKEVFTVKWLRLIFFTLITGCCDAAAVTWFLSPLHFNSGGATGIVMLAQHIFPALPMGIGLIVLNVILFLCGLRVMSFRYLGLAMLGAVLQAGVFLAIANLRIPDVQSLSLLAAVFGGILEGWAVAISFKNGVSFGGMDLLTKIVQRVTEKNIGTVNLILKFLILLGSFVLNPSWFDVCGSILFLMVTMFITNWIVLGRKYLHEINVGLYHHFVDPIHRIQDVHPLHRHYHHDK